MGQSLQGGRDGVGDGCGRAADEPGQIAGGGGRQTALDRGVELGREAARRVWAPASWAEEVAPEVLAAGEAYDSARPGT
ncbi:hypothetical protein ABZU86_00090 [Streptomyces sp. NPDC005271]|uniref:hypothetical protein n=1 Tax=unclassified Streptomyces TaxID=2593676 RepID=UPI0033B2A9A5